MRERIAKSEIAMRERLETRCVRAEMVMHERLETRCAEAEISITRDPQRSIGHELTGTSDSEAGGWDGTRF